MRTKKVMRAKMLKGEKLMIFLGVFLGLIVLPVTFVYTKAVLSESSISLEKIKYKMERQASTNEALEMQIDELASIENIQDIALSNGLSYNNDNIKTISE